MHTLTWPKMTHKSVDALGKSEKEMMASIQCRVGVALLLATMAASVLAQQPPPPPPPPPPPIEPVPQLEFADGVHQMLWTPMVYEVGASGLSIIVPAGFVHDNASVPSPVWSWLPTHGRYGKAAIVHDYLYWAQPCTRRQADNLLMLAMKESSVPFVKRAAVYRGVRLGGGKAFRQNREARANGGFRVIPEEHRGLPRNVTWPEYEITLRDRGVHDPDFPEQPPYCRLGDSTDVPDVAVVGE